MEQKEKYYYNLFRGHKFSTTHLSGSEIFTLLKKAYTQGSKGDDCVEDCAKILSLFILNHKEHAKGTIRENFKQYKELPLNKKNLYNSLRNPFTTSEGWTIANGLGITERTYKRFLANRFLFTKLKHGEYMKNVNNIYNH